MIPPAASLRRCRIALVAALIAAVGLTLAAAPARAQAVPVAREAPTAGMAPDAAVRVLAIEGGRLLLDGRAFPPSAVPEGLDLGGLSMHVEFSGPVTPVIEVDGQAYVLDGERLVRFEDSERAGDQVYFLGQPEPAGEEAADPRRARAARDAAYLRGLSARDEALVARIERERALEQETLDLAARLRATPPGPAHDALAERLRDRLAASFDLKQDVRQAEVEQVEVQLAELQRLLRERAARKDRIIEHRFRELTGQAP